MSSEELALWVVFNKKGDAYKGYSFEVIHEDICRAIENQTLIIDTDDDGQVTGVAVCELRVHVKQIIATKPSTFGRLLKLMRLLFPSIKTFQAFRHGRIKEYYRPNHMLNKVYKEEQIYG